MKHMTTNHFPFITVGTEIPAFDWNMAAGTSGELTMHAHYGATFSDVVIRFGLNFREVGMMVVRIDADRRVTEVVSFTPASPPALRSGRMTGFRRVSDGHGCTESVMV